MICANKKTYSTHKDAKAVMKKIKMRFNNTKLTDYKCEHCKFFHLTSCNSEERRKARILSKG